MLPLNIYGFFCIIVSASASYGDFQITRDKLDDPSDLNTKSGFSLHGRAFQDLVIVRPFCTKDYKRMLASFDLWNKFMPCSKYDHTRYHLVLSYSRDINSGFGLVNVRPLLQEFVESFNEKREEWHQCISSIELHSAKIPYSVDIYRPDEYYQNPDWVNGPNRQFTAITNWFTHQHQRHYDIFFLMELDTVPVKPYFLTSLSREIESERPFAILGSHYRGDRWDQIMDKITPSLKYHINGNAVYNLSHPIYEIVTRQLVSEQDTTYHRFPYDYRISQIIYQNDLLFQFSLKWNEKSFFYKGWSRTVANYASTNLATDFLSEESLVHGGHFYQLYTGPMALVVSDWGLDEELENFHQTIISGDHPFTEVIYVVPASAMSRIGRRHYRETVEGVRGPILVRYLARDNDDHSHSSSRSSFPDYLDHCRFQPETTEFFMTTNTYMRPVYPFSLYQVDGKFLISYIAGDSSNCQNSHECGLILEEARASTEYLTNITIGSMSTVYHRDILGNLNDNGEQLNQLLNSRHSQLRDKINEIESFLGLANSTITAEMPDNFSQDINISEDGGMENYTTYKLPSTLGRGYCRIWYDFYKEKTGYTDFNSSCQAYPGPTGTGYYAYVQKHNMTDYYHFNNLLHTGSREAFVPNRNPPNRHNICPQSRDYLFLKYQGSDKNGELVDGSRNAHILGSDEVTLLSELRNTLDTFTSWLGHYTIHDRLPTENISSSVIPEYKLTCVQVMNDPELCNELPYCWYRPGFERCLPLYDPTQTKTQSQFGDQAQNQNLSLVGEPDADVFKRQALALDFRQGFNYPSTPQSPCDCSDGWTIWGITCIPLLAVAAGLVLLLLLGLCILVGLLATSCGLAYVVAGATAINDFFGSQTFVGFPRHVATDIYQETIVPEVSGAVIPSGPAHVTPIVAPWPAAVQTDSLPISSRDLQMPPPTVPITLPNLGPVTSLPNMPIPPMPTRF